MTILNDASPKMLRSSYSNTEIPAYPSQSLLNLLIHPSMTQAILPSFQSISRSYGDLHAVARNLLLELDEACQARNQFQQECVRLRNEIKALKLTNEASAQKNDACEIND